MKNLYEVMGVPKNASEEDIKRSYRSLVMKYHPDHNHEEGATEKFKEISDAYEILVDPNKRQQYDTFGEVNPNNQRPFTSAFNDAFSHFFGGHQKRQMKGRNISVSVSVTTKQALYGDKVDVSFHRSGVCEKCQGCGGDKVVCKDCGGQGVRLIRTENNMVVQISCPSCRNKGHVVNNICGDCGGTGFSSIKEEKISFDIFPGVENGMSFVHAGSGEPCPDGIPGDLIIQCVVENHKHLQRLDNGNVILEYPITYAELSLGTEIQVPTLEKTVEIKIPPGTQTDAKFRLKGLGFPIFNNTATIYNHGDQYVQVKIVIPTSLNEKHTKLLKKLNEIKIDKVSETRREILGE